MSGQSNIEWTEATWNPITGCTRVSAGCDHCYAVSMTRRLEGAKRARYVGLVHNGHFNGVVRCHEDLLEQPLRWRKPRAIFVCSMSDLFHPKVPFEFIDKVFAVMALCPQHTFQILTKRPERMEEYLASRSHPEHGSDCLIHTDYVPVAMENMGEDYSFAAEMPWPLPNVWLGVTIESSDFAGRADRLQEIPAAVRFISHEPALGPLDGLNLDGISQVITGGESGPGARPMHPDWARGVRDQCNAAGVAFFFKQWGSWAPNGQGCDVKGIPYGSIGSKRVHWLTGGGEVLPIGSELLQPGDANHTLLTTMRIGKKRAGRLLDGREWNERPGKELREEETSPAGS